MAISVAALLLITAILALLSDPRVASGSDVGGKLATVKTMAESGTWTPDVGYWAETEDPEGRFHQLIKTRETEQGWIQVTGLPLMLPAVPLWSLGGPGALLLLTVPSATAAGIAARRLARQLGARSGWGAFWLVGLGSPVFVYSADFWEHAPSVAIALWVLTLALSLSEDRPVAAAVPASLGLGALAALGVLLRAEVALSLGCMALALLFVSDERRRIVGSTRRYAGAAVIAVSGYLLASMLEGSLVGAGTRSGRGSTQLSQAGLEPTKRVTDAALTSVGLWADQRTPFLLIGGLVVCLLACAVAMEVRGRPLSPAVLGAACLLVLIRCSDLDFVPGALIAAPAATAVAGVVSTRQRALAAGAGMAMVATWLLSWRGDMETQWGGRYLLVPAAVLCILGAMTLERIGWRRPIAVVLVVLTAIITTYGAVWHVVRSNRVAAAFESIEAVPADVILVATGIDSGRTAGAWYGEHRWLTAPTPSDLPRIMGLAASASAERVDVVYPEPIEGARPIEGATETGRRKLAVLSGVEFTIISYRPTG